MPTPPKHDYAALIEEYDQRLASGELKRSIEADFDSRGIHPRTFQNRRTLAKKVHQGTPEGHRDTRAAHPSTPEVHPEVSLRDSTSVHSGVPARQEPVSTPMVHPGTPSDEDWQLWLTIKDRWLEVEKLLADRHAALSTLLGTPGHTQKKTYVFDVRHVRLIERYAHDHRLDLKEVLHQALEEFFHQRGYVAE
jgi:hypothetical protein